jgi:hypothetical protein
MKNCLEIEHAAELSGELAFLHEVTCDILNVEAHSRYAEWLDDNGEQSRAAFMRELSTAIVNLGPRTKIPQLYSYDTSWTNMVGLPLAKAIAQHDLYDHSNFIFRAAKPTLKIELENVIQRAMRTGEDTPHENDIFAIGQTKFEGLPDIPANIDWPKNEHGFLRFLAQINLTEIAGTVAAQSMLVREGTLSFFAMPGENEPTGNIAENNCFCLYFAPSLNLVRRSLPSGIAEECESGPAVKLLLTETWDLPGSDTLESEKFQAVHGRVGNYETEEELHEIRLELHQLSNHLFGYPVDCSSHINPAPEGYSNLLTLVDNTATRWFWGDGDGLNVSVPFDRILELEKPQPTCGVVG